jgi:hypothetical protein
VSSAPEGGIGYALVRETCPWGILARCHILIMARVEPLCQPSDMVRLLVMGMDDARVCRMLAGGEDFMVGALGFEPRTT